MKKKLLTIVLTFIIFGCSEPYPPLSETKESFEEYNEWISNKFQIDPDNIDEYILKTSNLKNKYVNQIKISDYDPSKLTNEFIENLLQLTTEHIDINYDDFVYLISPDIDPNSSPEFKRLVKLIQKEQLQASRQIKSVIGIMPINVLSIIPEDIKTKNDGLRYAKILEGTKYPIFIKDDYWLKEHKKNLIIKRDIKKIEDLWGEINLSTLDLNAKSIDRLLILREEMLNSRIVSPTEIIRILEKRNQHSGIMAQTATTIDYDYSRHEIVYGSYKLDSIITDLDTISNAELSNYNKVHLMKEVEYSQERYDLFKNKLPQTSKRMRDIKETLEYDKAKLQEYIDKKLAPYEAEVKQGIQRFKDLKVQSDKSNTKYLNYKTGYLSNLRTIITFFNEINALGIPESTIQLKFAGFFWEREKLELIEKEIIDIDDSIENFAKVDSLIWKKSFKNKLGGVDPVEIVFNELSISK